MLWYRRRSCASGVAREELGGELLDVRGLPQLDGAGHARELNAK